MRRFLISAAVLLGLATVAVVAGLLWFRSTYGPSRSVEYARVGDQVLESYIFEPKDDGGDGPRPAVLLFHGGGWRHGHPSQLFHTATFLAEHGYVVLSAAYRLKGDGATPFDCVDDAKRAYRWLWDQADSLRIDRSRIVVGGSSAGGHLAAAVAMLERSTDPVDPPAALILFNPALDTAFEEPMHDAYRQFAGDFLGRGREISPTHHVRSGAPPTIVFHGRADGLVPFDHSRIFCERLRAVGSVCELVAYPDAGHGFYNIGRTHVDDVDARMVAFLEELRIAD